MKTASSLSFITYLLWLLVSLLSVVSTATAQETTPQVLRVVGDNNYPPFLFIDPAGRASGYVADWWALWEKKTGVKVELTATNWAEAQRIIGRGQADVIDNIFKTPQREPLYDFTAPYADVPVAIYKHDSIAGIQDVKGLRGFQIGVMAGDACIDMLSLKGINNLHEYKDYTALINAALAEDVKIFCLDEYPANYYLYREKAQKTFHKAFQLYEGRFHRAVKKGNTDILQLVERGAAAISPEEDRALRKKWMRANGLDYIPYIRYLALGTGVLAFFALIQVVWLRSMQMAVKRKTAELRESEERFRTLFEDTCQPIMLLEEGRFVDANKAALSMLRMERLEQLVGLTPVDISPEYQPDGKLSTDMSVELSRTSFENGFKSFEWEHIRTDGEHFIVQVLLTVIRQGNRNLLHSVWNDITARKLAEMKVMELNQELEKKVALRTAELSELNSELSALIYSISHDLKAPLIRIKGYADVLLDTSASKLAEEELQYIARLKAASNRLDEHIEALLKLYQITRGDFYIEPVNLSAMAETILNDFHDLEPERQVRYSVAAGMVVDADKLLMKEFMDNLISNAWRYTLGKDDATIELGVMRHEGREIYYIRDNGVGFDMDQIDNIFRPFLRLHGDDTGLGIGLASVQRIIRLHGGKIWADGKKGEGATFYFTLT